jgi:hypothetical protein
MWSRKRSEAAKARFGSEVDALREGWGPTAVTPEPEPPENLTLYRAVVWAWGEHSGLRVPVIRVRIDAVLSWWVGNTEQIKGSSSGAWFAFISVPLNLGQ